MSSQMFKNNEVCVAGKSCANYLYWLVVYAIAPYGAIQLRRLSLCASLLFPELSEGKWLIFYSRKLEWKNLQKSSSISSKTGNLFHDWGLDLDVVHLF